MTEPLKIVKQLKPGQCLAACVAMLARVPLDTVLAECRMLQGKREMFFLPESEAVKFLAKYRLSLGLRLKPLVKLTSEHEAFNVEVEMAALPALLGVKSHNFEDLDHAVVWCNQRKMVLDPWHAEPQPLDNYEVWEWTPVVEV